MIEVAQLTRRYGNLLAVDDVSFQLERGEVVGLLGPNGAGKTTTMRILTGFLPASQARRLVVAGHDVLRDGLAARSSIGYLPETVPLYREMRVSEMLDFQGQLHGMERADRKSRAAEVLDRVGVSDRSKALVGTLSRGLRQRVGLAVALLPNPEVLILDEPTSGLDPLQRIEVRALIAELAADHTVLVSSHILAEIEAICPRVLIMHKGQLLADGTRGDLVERFAGQGQLNLEAAVPDAAEAARLLGQLPGVERVDVGAKVGVHQGFSVHGDGDLREDVGALALMKGWALRELTWDRPNLEMLFARLVLGEEGLEAAAAKRAANPVAEPASAQSQPAGGPAAATTPSAADGDGLLQLSPSAGKPTAPADTKIIYSLNPFDQGANRNLGAPMEVTPPPPPPGQHPEGGA